MERKWAHRCEGVMGRQDGSMVESCFQYKEGGELYICIVIPGSSADPLYDTVKVCPFCGYKP